MATYGPGIDQSQHMKSVSHIIIVVIIPYLDLGYHVTVIRSLRISTTFF